MLGMGAVVMGTKLGMGAVVSDGDEAEAVAEYNLAEEDDRYTVLNEIHRNHTLEPVSQATIARYVNLLLFLVPTHIYI